MKPRLLLTALIAGICLLSFSSRALASTTQFSIMQDDQELVDSDSATMFSALATMESLGVQTVRVNVEWNSIAPDPTATSLPAGESAKDPGIYADSAGWANYDRLVNAAALYGITLQFNLTGPGPLWAMAQNSPTARAATHWEPNANDFGAFVQAVATRYDGGTAGLGTVSSWSIWNEPNQPGWLAPQWLTVKGKKVAESPRYYRQLLRAGWNGLAAAGDTTTNSSILIGETAPEGQDSGSFYTAMTPIPFLQGLYCLNAKNKRLTGAAAKALGCPASGSAAAFATANPALFKATGFSHHPYDFTKAPNVSLPDATEAPLSDIGRLERFLNAAFKDYGSSRKIPLYFTEYGYETNPPDPHRKVTPAEQAAYLNEADYMSWKNSRIKSVAQFLLFDSAPDARYSPSQYDYWDTFQTGLETVDGTPKPALAAYRLPIWMPQTHVKRSTRTLVWGQVRPADRLPTQPVQIQWSATVNGTWSTLATAYTKASSGYFTINVKLPANGYVRTSWTYTTPTGAVLTFQSRNVPVIVNG